MKNLELEYDKKNLDNNLNFFNSQNNSLYSILNKVINWSIDEGIKYLLPDSIENEVIKIKNSIIIGKSKDNINNAIKEILSNKNKKNELKDINELENLLKNPKTIKILSEVVENILDNKEINGLKNKNNGDEKHILKNMESNLDNELNKQIKSIGKIKEYTDEWYKYFEKKEINSMNTIYKKIEKELKTVVPLENILKETRKIENLNQLIKFKGGDFNITKEEMELASKLVY